MKTKRRKNICPYILITSTIERLKWLGRRRVQMVDDLCEERKCRELKAEQPGSIEAEGFERKIYENKYRVINGH